MLLPLPWTPAIEAVLESAPRAAFSAPAAARAQANRPIWVLLRIDCQKSSVRRSRSVILRAGSVAGKNWPGDCVVAAFSDNENPLRRGEYGGKNNRIPGESRDPLIGSYVRLVDPGLRRDCDLPAPCPSCLRGESYR